jgi:glycosyltransferase involved in cell wall biosynthesis
VAETLMARVLFLTSRLPYPPREGHQLRSWHLLRAVAEVHEVTLLSCLRRDDAPDQCAPLRAVVSRLETFALPAERSRLALADALLRSTLGPHPFVAEKYSPRRLRTRVNELARESDLIHVDMLPLMHAIGEVTNPLVLNAHNVEHLLLRQRADQERAMGRRLFINDQVPKLLRFERDACRRADHVLACSEDDARTLAALAPQTPISVVPNGVDLERCQPGGRAVQPARMIFVGPMSWFPNLDGMQWFLRDVLPRILALRSDAQLTIVGKSNGLDVPESLRSHVRLAGFVENLQAEFDEAAVCIVPLRAGSGTRLKVLEAMAFGKAIVTTSIGAQGIDLADGDEALFADDPATFANAVLELFADPRRAAHLGKAARAKAQARYDWRAIGRDLLAIYDGLLRTPAVDGFADQLVDRELRLAQR